jgi:hypothetical protein
LAIIIKLSHPGRRGVVYTLKRTVIARLGEYIANPKECPMSTQLAHSIWRNLLTLSYKGIHQLPIIILQSPQVFFDKGLVHLEGTTTQHLIDNSADTCTTTLKRKTPGEK